jgi:FixJ family two-component response regulator
MLHVVVVDDDANVRTALKRLLRAIGHDVQLFSCAEDFLAQDIAADCVILDVHLPGLSGLDVEERLSRGGAAPAVVFITGHDSAATRDAFERARRPWLRKPFDEQRLIDAISRATARQG